MHGTLVSDPEVVAARLNIVLASGTSARSLGLKVAKGHVLTADDVRSVDRQLVELRPA